ncbi:MAG: OmpA family protein [Treponema sp.]|nr:OmpA family protein [Treponema sp.]
MKKIVVLIFAVSIAVIACKTPPENPNSAPVIDVAIPELFSPDPDVPNDKMSVAITISHPVPIKDWTIEVQPVRRQAGQAAQRQGGQAAQRPEGEQRERPEGEQRRRRAAFFEQSGKKDPPKTWQWDGKGTSGEMVQSATDYTFSLSVNDIFDNSGTYEGIISVDVLVRREGDVLRIIVPSIVFPPNSADFRLLDEEDMRSNRRVLGLIARALTRFDDYAITVEGHANPTTPPGTPERAAEEISDKPLSEQRADAVVAYLAENGHVQRQRLTVAGMGSARPVADYDDDDENWKNRRVEFILRK